VRSGRFADEIMQMSAVEKEALRTGAAGGTPKQTALSRQ